MKGNFVAKHMHKLNRATKEVNKFREQKRTGDYLGDKVVKNRSNVSRVDSIF